MLGCVGAVVATADCQGRFANKLMGSSCAGSRLGPSNYTLEGACSRVALFKGISPISGDYLKTLTEMGAIRKVGAHFYCNFCLIIVRPFTNCYIFKSF